MTEPEFNPYTWEITLTDNKDRSRRYAQRDPLPYREVTDAEITATGKAVLKSDNLKDDIRAGRMPKTFSVASAFGVNGFAGNWKYFEYVLSDSEESAPG